MNGAPGRGKERPELMMGKERRRKGGDKVGMGIKREGKNGREMSTRHLGKLGGNV